MVSTMKMNVIVGGIFGAILIFYLIGAVWNDAGESIADVNTSIQGSGLIVLLPLILAIGVVVALYKGFMGNK